jgi:hypothetical protein
VGAEFEGVAMVPGVSLNRRLYTRELIGKAVARAQERLAAGLAPLTMLTHHAAEDDSLRIVGQLTEIRQDEDGAARFRGRFADTPEADTISALVIPEDGSPPFLRGVSIRGWWLGEVQRVLAPDGAPADTADDLELDGIDFTKTPGVVLAGVSTDERAQGGRTMVRESVTPAVGGHAGGDAEVGPPSHAPTATATTPTRWADLGYRGERRLPIGTPREAVETWRTLATEAGVKGYTAGQRKRLRNRTREALAGHGLTVTEDGTVLQRVAEGFEWGWSYDGSMQVRLSNGPIDVAVCTWCVDPAALDQIGMAAMRAALDALGQLDPDADGDIDVGAAESTETAPDDGVTETAPVPAGSPAAPTEETEPAVGDTTKAAETAAPEALTTAHIPALAEAISKGIADALRPAAAPATEAAPAAQETAPAAAATSPAVESAPLTAEAVRQLLKEQRDEIRREVIAQYGPRRRGLVTGGTVTTESGEGGVELKAPDKPLHELGEEDFAAHATNVIDQILPG